MKSNLTTAGTVAFDLSIIAMLMSLVAAVYWAATEKLELAILAMIAGTATLLAGIIIKGLIRLFVAIHDELEKMNGALAVHTKLFASIANREE